jgi:hypothetical protein
VACCLVIILGVGYLFVFRPMMKELARATPEITRLMADFSRCMETEPTENCGRFTSNKFKSVVSNSDLELLAKKIHQVLGARLTGEVDKDSLSYNKNAPGDGTIETIISGRFKAMYEKDPFVVEQFSCIYNSNDKTYKILRFQTDSKLFLK